MLIGIEKHDSICILQCEGRFVAGLEMEYVQTKLEEVKRLACNKVVANFEKVTSLGSIGITFIVGTYTSVIRMPGGGFVLVGASSMVQRVLDLARPSTVIPQADDVASGLALLNGQIPAVPGDKNLRLASVAHPRIVPPTGEALETMVSGDFSHLAICEITAQWRGRIARMTEGGGVDEKQHS